MCHEGSKNTEIVTYSAQATQKPFNENLRAFVSLWRELFRLREVPKIRKKKNAFSILYNSQNRENVTAQHVSLRENRGKGRKFFLKSSGRIDEISLYNAGVWWKRLYECVMYKSIFSNE